MSLRNRIQGFLLIEVLVTVAMLAFSLIYITRAFTNCLRAMSQIANYTTAINLAEEKIFQLQSESQPEMTFTPLETTAQPPKTKRFLTGFTEEGVFADNPNFNFKLEAKKLEDLELSELYLQVNWKEGRRTGSFDLNTYLR
jgi:type II secretory pathway pseudopilin PulG